MPKLSIIIPVYNAEQYIAACIDSVLSQSFSDYELILVNDGSKDASGEICERYKLNDSRIIVCHQHNCGVSKARNRGLEIATGDYITFVDADDELLPGFLDSFTYDNEIDFEIQGFVLNYKNKPASNKIFQPSVTQIRIVKDVFDEAEFKRLSRGPVCKLFKNELIRKYRIRFPENLSFGEDAIFVKQYIGCCGKYGRTIAVANYLYNDFGNQDSLTKRRHDYLKFYEYTFTDLRLYKGLEEKFGKFPAESRSFFMRERSLEMYWSIVLCMTQNGVTDKQKADFVRQLKTEMFAEVPAGISLPQTYRFFRFCMNYLPAWGATKILNRTINKFIKI